MKTTATNKPRHVGSLELNKMIDRKAMAAGNSRLRRRLRHQAFPQYSADPLVPDNVIQHSKSGQTNVGRVREGVFIASF